jgi:hypothetical protein
VSFPKVCACSATYTPESFSALPLVGFQVVNVDDGEPPMNLEIRDCAACGSSIAIDRAAEGQ